MGDAAQQEAKKKPLWWRGLVAALLLLWTVVVWVAKDQVSATVSAAKQSYFESRYGSPLSAEAEGRQADAVLDRTSGRDHEQTRFVTGRHVHARIGSPRPDNIWTLHRETRERVTRYSEAEARALATLRAVEPRLQVERVADTAPLYVVTLGPGGLTGDEWDRLTETDPYAILPPPANAAGRRVAERTGSIRPPPRLDWLAYRAATSSGPPRDDAVRQAVADYRAEPVSLATLAAELDAPSEVVRYLIRTDPALMPCDLGILCEGGTAAREQLEAPLIGLYSPFQHLAISATSAKAMPPARPKLP